VRARANDGEGLSDALLPSQRVAELRKKGGQPARFAQVDLCHPHARDVTATWAASKELAIGADVAHSLAQGPFERPEGGREHAPGAFAEGGHGRASHTLVLGLVGRDSLEGRVGHGSGHQPDSLDEMAPGGGRIGLDQHAVEGGQDESRFGAAPPREHLLCMHAREAAMSQGTGDGPHQQLRGRASGESPQHVLFETGLAVAQQVSQGQGGSRTRDPRQGMHASERRERVGLVSDGFEDGFEEGLARDTLSHRRTYCRHQLAQRAHGLEDGWRAPDVIEGGGDLQGRVRRTPQKPDGSHRPARAAAEERGLDHELSGGAVRRPVRTLPRSAHPRTQRRCR
jgi:hypothetical protein